MPKPADDDDKWLHRFIFKDELTEDGKVHPQAWERFDVAPKLPAWRYVLSGTSWKKGKNDFIDKAREAIERLPAKVRQRTNAAYLGFIYQTVENIRAQGGVLGLEVIDIEDQQYPAHFVLVTNTEIRPDRGTISPEVSDQLNQIFTLVLHGSQAEAELLD